ncbi:MAG TPA: 3',5'-cyclic-nucleotide phosphodiesterase [Thermodesulfovibrionales bacterium]|nr:3',5'-cyclic-nucleotide phosphodiesterase [Thermodesulfovibrionales bacterium]
MKIKVIGCSGAQFPGHKAPSFLLDDEIIFDAGSFTGVLDEKAQLRIKHIFITHAHLDHIMSIPFLADNIIVSKQQNKVSLYSIPPVLKMIKEHLFNSALWPDFTIIPKPDDAILNLVKLSAGKSIRVNSYTITPYEVNHTVPAVGYLVQDGRGKRFFYTGDTGPSAKTWEKLSNKKMNCLIIDVSFPNSLSGMALRSGHLTPELLIKEMAKMQQKPEKVCITHLKPQYFRAIKEELNDLGIKNLRILEDGDTIRV